MTMKASLNRHVPFTFLLLAASPSPCARETGRTTRQLPAPAPASLARSLDHRQSERSELLEYIRSRDAYYQPSHSDTSTRRICAHFASGPRRRDETRRDADVHGSRRRGSRASGLSVSYCLPATTENKNNKLRAPGVVGRHAYVREQVSDKCRVSKWRVRCRRARRPPRLIASRTIVTIQEQRS